MIEPREIFGGLGNRMFQGAYIYSQFKKGLIPDIYIQDPKYFEDFKNDIILLYYQGNIPRSEYVSLHIRRGDYIDNSFYVDLTKTDYYDKAIALFPDKKFLVFCADRQVGSNDIEDQAWCMEWLKFKYKDRVKLYKSWLGTEIEDMNAMIGCDGGHIMANSSFSWWASYLGGGKVVAPSKWFTDGVQRVGLLNEWIKI